MASLFLHRPEKLPPLLVGKDLIFSVCVAKQGRQLVIFLNAGCALWAAQKRLLRCFASFQFSAATWVPEGPPRATERWLMGGGGQIVAQASPPGFITAPSVSYSGQLKRVQQFKAPLRAASEHFFILPRPNFLARKRALQPRASHPSSPGYIELAANRPHAVLLLRNLHKNCCAYSCSFYYFLS